MGNGSRWTGRAALVAGLVCGALLVSNWLVRDEGHVRAGVREATPPKHFLSGGARSETVLIEISATLKRIEARLERLEAVAQRSVGAKQALPPVETEPQR